MAPAAALVVAMSAENLLQIVVGVRQIGHGIAVKQTRPVTFRHLQKVLDSRAQAACQAAMGADLTEQALVATAHFFRIEAVAVGEDFARRIEPPIDAFDRRPQLGRCRQCPINRGFQPTERWLPFFVSSTRSRLCVIASSCAFIAKPPAQSGSLAGAVSAARTAVQ